jgi:hypothetical protein
LRSTLAAVRQRSRPDKVAVSLHHGVRAANFQSFFRIECGVNSAEDDKGSALSRQFANLISAQGIPRVDSNANDIAGLDAEGIKRSEGLINEDWIAERGWCCRGNYEEPARSDNGSAK